MDSLSNLAVAFGRWLAYADHCVSAEEQSARCQPFWTFVAAVLGAVCLIALGSVAFQVLRERKKKRPAATDARFSPR